MKSWIKKSIKILGILSVISKFEIDGKYMKKLILFLSIICLAACNSLDNFPKEQYAPAKLSFKEAYENDTISFSFKEPSHVSHKRQAC